MKTKIALSFIYLFILSCNGLKKEEIKSSNNIVVATKINDDYIKKINKTNIKNKKIQIIENDSIIELWDNGSNYLESKKKTNEMICNKFAYNKQNNLLIESATYFHDIPIGILKKYDDKGRLIEQINKDKNYTFSIYDLIKKIKSTHQIDLNNDKEQNRVDRDFDKSIKKYIYVITYEKDKNKAFQNGKAKYISIDGQTGKVLSEGTTTFGRF
nr:hypothetical protein [uncultured Flavobacterium sp.]